MLAAQLPSDLLGTSKVANAAPTLDQSSPSGTTGGFTLGAGTANRAGQTVTAGLAGWLTEVDLDVFCQSGAQLSIDIQGVTADGLPDGVVKTRLLVDGPINATGFHPFYFSTPVSIASGERFAIVVGETFNSATLICSITHGAEGDGYAPGAGFFRSSTDASWRALQPGGTRNDWPFKTYVTSSTNADVAINSSSVQVTGTSTITFSVGVVNRGPDDATGATITYNFGGPVTITGWNQTQPGRCINDGGYLSCPIAPFVANGGFNNNIFVKRTGVGTITMTASVSANEVDANPDNNTASLSSPDMPDLIVTSLIAPSTITSGGKATYAWTIKNQGTATATAVTGGTPPFQWGDQLWLSTSATSIVGAQPAGGLIAARSLAPGESYTSTFSPSVPTVPAGSYYLILQVDNGSQIAESDETNNLFAVPVTVVNSTLIVNTAADHDDGVCDVADCTLREAINAANARAGADSIIFRLPFFTCGGPVVQIYTNNNGQGVSGGGVPPSFSTNGTAYCVTHIWNYHWVSGDGIAPGQVSLTNAAGATIGSWPAVGTPGQPPNTSNANWDADVPLGSLLINGTYFCEDSDHPSWSQNAASNLQGFCTVSGQLATIFQPTIYLNTPLPAITDAVVIDGTSQDAGPVVIDGASAGAGATGLSIGAAASTVRAIAIRNFGTIGIYVGANGG